MSRSSAIGVLIVISLLIASEVLSAPRENLIPHKESENELMETRETEFLEARSERLMRNERFDVSREDELLHRLTRAKEPLSSEVEKNSTATNISKSSDENSKSNSTVSETKDLNGPRVTPVDDDDVKTTTVIPATIKPPNSTTDSKNLVPPKIFPDDARVKSIKDASKEVADKLNKTNYEIDGVNITKSSEKTNETIINPVDVVDETQTSKSPSSTTASLPTTVPTTAVPKATAAPPAANSTEAPIVTTTETTKPTEPTTVETTRPPTAKPTKRKWPLPEMLPTTTEEPLIPVSYTPTTPQLPKSSTLTYAEIKLHEKKKKDPNTAMPSGIVALITALTFCIVAVVVYTGLFVRRRYTEWRYGNRELLVNEFDSTDVSHFEL